MARSHSHLSDWSDVKPHLAGPPQSARLTPDWGAEATNAETMLYRHASELVFPDLPRSTVENVAALVLDHFGCALLGMRLPWTSALLTSLRRYGEISGSELPTAPGASTPPEQVAGDRWQERLLAPSASSGAQIYGQPQRLPAQTAALVNATATHGFDLDDTHLPTMSHPGCVIIPAAVAAAEITGAAGQSFLAAVAAGYEVMGRAAAATGLGFGEKGFHATGQVGPMGAAAACARLLGTDVPGAVGLAASFGGGIKAFRAGNGMVKRLHAGRAAQAGLFAAMLQSSGFSGPTTALTGRFGFLRTYSTDRNPDWGRLATGIGDAHVVDDVYIKPYAACGAVHGAVAAASTLAVRSPDEIHRVMVGTSRRALEQNSIPDPTDAMAAQYSTEYSVALALLGGARQPLRYLDVGTDHDRQVRELAARVTLTVDEQAEHAYPDTNQAQVEVWLSDGTRHAARGSVTAGTSRGWTLAKEKFRTVTEGVIAHRQQDRLVHAVAALSQDGLVRDCLDAIADRPTHGSTA